MDISLVITRVRDSFIPFLVTFGTRILGAIALWVVGRLIISGIKGLVRRAGERRKFDPTLVRYIDSLLSITLQVMLVIAILGVFGVETASFAGLLAGAGLAIGMAWSGLLSNFAAGVFMIFLRPFRVGDLIGVAGQVGVVHEIGLFATTMDTPDSIRVVIGNAKIMGDTIQNLSANPFRRIDLTAQIAHGVDPADAIRRLRERLTQHPVILKTPAPDIEILSFNLAGTVLAVRPYARPDDYWTAYFAGNAIIAEEFGKAGYPVPENHYYLRKTA